MLDTASTQAARPILTRGQVLQVALHVARSYGVRHPKGSFDTFAPFSV